MKFLANLFGKDSADAKNLEQSRAQLAAAKASAEQVAALFTSAGLDLDALLLAGPDALRAHLASLSAKDGELATAQTTITELQGKLETATADLTTAKASNLSLSGALSGIGFTATDTANGVTVKAAFDSHVKKAAALELAKAGHAPLEELPAVKAATVEPVKAESNLKGRERYEADFNAQVARMSAKRTR